MSSWDFNSWDYKSSYTYKGAMQIKRTLEKAFYNNRSAGNYQQPFKKNNRRPPGAPPYNNQNPTPPPNGYNYEYKYTQPNVPNQQNGSEPIITPPPNNQQQNQNYNQGYQRQYTNYQPIKPKKEKRKKNKEPEVLDPNTIVKIKKSAVPLYAVGIFWVLYAMFFPIYRWYDFIIVIAISFFVYILLSKIFSGTKIYIKVEEKTTSTGDSYVDKIIASGKEFSKQMHEASLGIEDGKLSLQISRLKEICDKILLFVSENPDKAPHIRKFMNYYVPTTLKLLKFYDKLEEQEIDGENIKSAMKNIEDAMDTIVVAFERQLDSLFVDEALDISTDITVLEGMLSQEGLLKPDFNKNKETNK